MKKIKFGARTCRMCFQSLDVVLNNSFSPTVDYSCKHCFGYGVKLYQHSMAKRLETFTYEKIYNLQCKCLLF